MEAAPTSCTTALQLAATDRTSNVFPHPGGPDSSAPLGQLMPSSLASAAYFWGHSAQGSEISFSSGSALSSGSQRWPSAVCVALNEQT